MIKNFSQYLVESEREVFFTFGRMNPPTVGHGKVFDALASKSGRADYKIYVSQSQNPKKDPLSYGDKVKHIRKMFPKHARSVMMDRNVKNVFDVASALYDQGYRNITMVVGEDRIREFEVLLNKYNGTKARHGFYNFENINVVSAGRRDPDAEGVEGMSASKQRANAQNNDFVSFSQGVPSSMSDRDARKLFNDVRKGMGLSEEQSFRNHVELEPVSETREAYVQGDLYDVGDMVVVKESEEVGIISHLGANYVIIEMSGERKVRKWLDAVELIEKKFEPHMMYDPKTGKGYKAEKPEDHERMSKMGYTHEKPSVKEEEDEDDTTTPQDPDIDDRKGSQPKRYHKGLAKSTKKARDRHFKKGAKMDDDNPRAYKPAPGDATAKTKPSKYTKQFKDMFDESVRVDDQRYVRSHKSKPKGRGRWSFTTKPMGTPKDNEVFNMPMGDYEQVKKQAQKWAEKQGASVIYVMEVAGDEGTDELRKKYQKQTPHQPVTEASYDVAVDNTFRMIMRDKRKSGGTNRLGSAKHSIEYYAGQVNKIMGFKLKTQKIAQMVRKEMERQGLKEDPVKDARARIEREKETDKAKHDRMLDRARALKTRMKNRETE